MAAAPQTKTPDRLIEHIVQQYGDMIFDLCESVLWSPNNAQLALKSILKEIRSTASRSDLYKTYERAWVLKITCDKLKHFQERHGRRLSPAEQMMLDATLEVPARLKQFDSYFHRLSTDDQILLLLRDKYGLPYSEIASATGLSEGSIKVKRQQALRTLEDWLWDQG